MALTVAKCKQIFIERDGQLYWARGYGHSRLWDKPAGCEDGTGRMYVTFEGERKYVAYVVWALHHGEFPKHRLMHLDHNLKNTRIDNLAPLKHKVQVTRRVAPTAAWFRDVIRNQPLEVRDDPRALGQVLHNEMMKWSEA
jgi:HNH endonuclease